ncbi:MAG: alkyl hydroperoxide reductase subunit F [Kofleriaceae bacterium]|nr:alkyl hydroperoxide reductase subunit F [Kofleriaceae bacterium]MCL4223563.1 alkyl hydroperoxide reductase subunit F [Myxococcales bacterium]
MLDPALQAQLLTYLERLAAPIELVAALDDSPTAAELRALLADLAAASPLVTTREAPADDRARRPSFTVGKPGEPARIRFAGVPLGHEFTSLVLALLQASGYPPRIEPELADAIRALPGPHHFETFVSLSCHNCPDVVQALDVLAALNPGITHTMIDGAAFQDEVAARGVMAVPTIFLDGQPFGQGRMELAEIVARLDAGAAARAAARLSEKPVYDVLVVGGGPAGAAAAIYAARKGIRTGLVAERFGGQVGDTLGIENLISVPYTEGPRLVAAMEQHVQQYGVDVTTLERVEALVPGRDGAPHQLRLASGATLRARTVVLAPGAKWRELNVPGEAEYRTRGVAFCPHCDGPLFKGKRVAVIGGGNSGVEAAIDLAGVVGHVTLLEVAGELRADAVLQAKLRSLPNVAIRVGAQTTEVTGDGQRVDGLGFTDRATGARHRLDVAGVFVQIGLVPSTAWLRDTLALSRHGEIEVDARGQTSVPGVFAAGDATTTPFKQIVIAMGDGARAALAAFEHLIRSGVATTAGGEPAALRAAG